MATPTLKDRKGFPIANETIDGLAALVAGKTIRPGDPKYDGARRIWNANVRKHPGLIVRCAGTADVVQVVKFARANNLLVSIRGGGHNVAGRALCDDGIVIDLSGMKGGASIRQGKRRASREVQRWAMSIVKLMPSAWPFQLA
jgi:hypothetical protein